MEALIRDIKAGMDKYWLMCNNNKTEMIIISSRYYEYIPFSGLQVGDTLVPLCDNVQNLEIIVESSKSMEKHINIILKQCYFHIKHA